jgi:hypothetical protein
MNEAPIYFLFLFDLRLHPLLNLALFVNSNLIGYIQTIKNKVRLYHDIFPVDVI